MSPDGLKAEFEGSRFLIVPGHYDFLGGAERQALILAESLKRDYGCHVDFLAWGGSGILAEKIRELRCIPWVFPLPEKQHRLARILKLLALTRFIKHNIHPDYLLPYVSYHCKVIGSIWRLTGARFTWWNQRDEGRLVYGTRTEHRLMRTLPCIASNSFEGLDFLVKKFNLSPDRVRVINNGVILPHPVDGTAWRARFGLDDSEILISMVANLTRYKDHATLLRAFAQVRESQIGQRCKLVFAGRHDETTKDLKALAFDLRLGDSVALPGAVDDIDGLLAASDLVAHSSVMEGCPNAVLEAMAHRKCVAGTDISGLRQALGDDAVGKYLAPPSDAARLAEIIIRLASSPAERQAAGDANRRRIERDFSVSGMTANVLQAIVECRI